MEHKNIILISGGGVSGLGKGLIASSLGSLLKNPTFLKIDPYLNVNAGTLGPSEHGEVFVLDDGTETDLDLGNYQRFCNINLTKDNTMTTGKLYKMIAEKEENGEYLGQTIQVVPHITNLIEEHIHKLAKDHDTVIIELGGTADDIENTPFVASLARYKEKYSLFHIHVSLVPLMGEYKTKPLQTSVKNFCRKELKPDLIIARTLDYNPAPKSMLKKIEDITLIKCINIHNSHNIYDIPDQLLTLESYFTMNQSYKIDMINNTLTIGICGKYSDSVDAYQSLSQSLILAGYSLGIKIKIVWNKVDVDGVVVAGGFGSRGIQEKINILKYCRENDVPCLGICLGMQCMVLEYQRNVLKIDAQSEEMSNENLVIRKIDNKMHKGGMLVKIKENTHLYEAYNEEVIEERFRHRYKVVDSTGFVVSARKNDEITGIELEDHPFYVGVQYHPEFKGSLTHPHPLFQYFLKTL